MDRMDELRKVAERLRGKDFTKEAQGGMDPMAGGMPPPGDPAAGWAPMMDPAMVPPVDPAMAGMDPSMMGMDPAAMGGEAPGVEAERGMKEVAMRAMDLTEGVISTALGSPNLSPAEKVDSAAAALQSSGAMQGVPPEEIAALAQQEAPVQM